MSCAKKLRKFVFSDEKKFNFDGLDGFQKYCHTKKFPEENYSTRHSGGGSPMIWRDFTSSVKLKIQFVSGRQKAADYDAKREMSSVIASRRHY